MRGNLEKLKLEIIVNGIEVGEAYKVWSRLVDKWGVSELSEKEEVEKDDARLIMMKKQFTFRDDLLKLGYLKIKQGTEDTYQIGSNSEDDFLVLVSSIFTEERGHINEHQNDYYETAKDLFRLVTQKNKIRSN